MRMTIIETTVGAFMLAAILSLAMLALKVSGLQTSFQEEGGNMRVYSEFTNIGGLKPRSKVTMAGVIIGRVTNIHLDPETFNAKVAMMINDRIKIPEDSRVSILTAGLLGDNYLNVIPGFSNTYLQEGAGIPLENTDSAMVLEHLVEKFLGQKASENKESKPSTSVKEQPSHE